MIFGDGPERELVLEAIDRLGLGGVVQAPGFVDSDSVEEALSEALCMVLPSSREGYGLIVVEAASMGVPSVVVAGEDNAAVDLVVEGVNGFVAASASPEALADAIVRVHDCGDALRRSTAEWFDHNARRLSLGQSLETVVETYAAPSRARL